MEQEEEFFISPNLCSVRYGSNKNKLNSFAAETISTLYAPPTHYVQTERAINYYLDGYTYAENYYCLL